VYRNTQYWAYGRTWTRNLVLTRDLHYQLCYIGICFWLNDLLHYILLGFTNVECYQGLEPRTLGLEHQRSSDWANSTVYTITYIIIFVGPVSTDLTSFPLKAGSSTIELRPHTSCQGLVYCFSYQLCQAYPDFITIKAETVGIEPHISGFSDQHIDQLCHISNKWKILWAPSRIRTYVPRFCRPGPSHSDISAKKKTLR
jgi:hypothetical protein